MLPRRRQDPETRRSLREVGIYSAIPIMLGVGPALGWYVAHLARQRWNGPSWWEALGVFIGLLAAFRQIYKAIKAGRTD